jgi:Putative motility protein
MDMSLVAAALAAQSGRLQSQVATTVLKSSIDSERSSVLTLLGAGTPQSLANVGTGVGGNINVTA